MTLIANLLTPDFLVQVGDTRVSRLTPAGIELVDDFRNKLIYYDGHAVFGYCGLTTLESLPTDEWITRVLSSRTFPSEHEAIEFLRGRAEKAVSQLPPDQRRLAIAGMGWIDSSQQGRYSVAWRISNFYEGDTPLASARDQFTVTYRNPLPNVQVVLLVSGWQPPPERTDGLERLLVRSIRQGCEPLDVIRRLVSWMRQGADESGGTVGRHLLSVYIPKRQEPTAIGSSRGQSMFMSMITTDSRGRPISVMAGGNPAEAAVFQAWPEHDAQPQLCSPRFALPGRDFSSFVAAFGQISGMAAQQLMRSSARRAPQPYIRFDLLPSHHRGLKPGDHLTIKCRVTDFRQVTRQALAAYEFVVLWHVEQLRYLDIQFGGELGGPGSSESAAHVLRPGEFNRSEPSCAAIVFSEKTLLNAADLQQRQSETLQLCKLRFSCLTDGPITLNPGVPTNPTDSAGRSIPTVYMETLSINNQ